MGNYNYRESSLINLSDKLGDAKKAVVALMSDTAPDAIKIFNDKDLESVEHDIKTVNEFGSKCWLVSAIALYSLIYDQKLYEQSGLAWQEYLKESKTRLGMDSRDVSEQLSSARFFINYHQELIDAGWTPVGSARKLARAEYAELLSGNHKETVKHVCEDSVRDFIDWYSSFESKKIIDSDEVLKAKNKSTYSIKGKKYQVNGVEALSVNADLPKKEKDRLNNYIQQIFESLQSGYEPAIIPVKDNDEANKLLEFSKKSKK